MTVKFEVLEKMNEYENEFCDELEANNIILLRDIKVTKKKLEAITNCISTIFKTRETKSLEKKFPLTTSLFLVWCAVYDYKDGDFWSIIFQNLKILNKPNHQRILGEIFLSTISEYKLLSIDNDSGKKYLSPILMHGYISNHYADSFFDYLNKVYSILLKYDVSESNIDSIWKDVFEEENDNESIEKEITKLELNIDRLKNEKSGYNVSFELLAVDMIDIEKQEKNIDELKATISSGKSKIEICKLKINDLQKALEYITEFDSSTKKISGIQSSSINNEKLQKVLGISIDLRNELNSQIKCNELEINNTTKEIKKTENKLSIAEDKLKVTNMNIAAVGKGSLEDGWYTIQRCNEIDSELNKLNRQLESKKSLIEVSQGIQNNSLRQVLTTSLNHLYKQNPQYFREFIIDTFQAIDSASRGEDVDATYPLYDNVIEWNQKIKVKTLGRTTTTNSENTENNTSNDIGTNIGEKENESDDTVRLRLQSLKEPIKKLDTYNWDIVLFVPAQKFDYIKNANKEPIYTLEGKDDYKINIDTQTFTDGHSIHINETSISIRKYDELIFTFEYFNLREAYILDIDSIMIFNDSGILLTGNKLLNGLYYVVCNNEWSSDFEGILDIYASGLDGFNVYEIQLNEEKALFKSLNNATIEYIGSNFSNASLVGRNIVEGITIDDIKISTGDLPNLLISLRDINPNDNILKVYMDDGLILNCTVNDLIQDTKFAVKEDLKLTFNINKFIAKNRKVHISKLKILLINKNNDVVFSEEFWNVTKNKFSYRNQRLLIKNPPGTRIKYEGKVVDAREFSIPLINETGEVFNIFYDRVGWKQFKVEVPTAKTIFRDSEENIVNVPGNLLASQLDILKDLYIKWEVNSSLPKTIYLYDIEKILETRLHLKGKKASANLYAYYDILKFTDDKNSLVYHWTGNNRNSEKECIINVFRQWEAYDIKCYSKEEEDEYIIELKYNCNFDFQSNKFLRIYNENSMIFEKELKDEQMIIYVKKMNIKSLNLNIKIGYYEKIDDIFGKATNEIIAGKYHLKLTSKINNLNLIKKHGIIATGFKYKGKSNKFKVPFKIEHIEKTDPINFADEELYMGQAIIKNKNTKVLFYLNMEDKTLPFLLDLERDGVQYHPKTGDIFWENRSGKEIMGPIDDISYVVKEE
ncbi:MAG: hypothetical protein PHE29_00305 [Tissierellia bacterium]|nr:hypothetical protein [Tissierellia bacterium]